METIGFRCDMDKGTSTLEIPLSKNPRLIDLSGQEFGLWKVTTQAGNAARGAALWNCVCGCGTERAVIGADLRNGKTRSCGCLINEQRLGDMNRTHGKSGSRLHMAWKNMRGRCFNKNRPQFADYGGRGITVCEDWSSFQNFEKWALSAGYEDALTIERVDVDGNYEPSNCTWATRAVQNSNRRFNQRSADGELWIHKARANGITDQAFWQRVYAGWGYELSVSWPMNKRRAKRPRDEAGKFL